MDVLGKEPTFFSRLNGLFNGILSFKSLFENTYITCQTWRCLIIRSCYDIILLTFGRVLSFYVYFVGVLFYFLGDPRPVKLIILMELWGGRSGWAFAQCSLTTFNYSLCLEVFWSFQDKNLSRVFAASSPLQWCLTMCLEISWKTQNNLVQWNSAVGESESVPMRDNIFIAASGQACIVLPWIWLRQKFSEMLARHDSLMEALWYSGHTFYEHEQFH